MMKVWNSIRFSLLAWLLPVAAFADEAGHAAASGGASLSSLIGIGAGLGMGIAVFGAAGAQGKIAAAFMEGVSRNPQAADLIRTMLILSLIFVETLVLFTLLIALQLVGKI